MKKRWVAVAIVAVLAAGAGYKVFGSHDRPPTFSLLTVSKGTIEQQAVAIGDISPAHSVEIKSQIDGIVGKIYHQVGDVVTAGTPLIKVNPNPTPITLTQATTALVASRAELESATQSVNNLQRLVDEHIIPTNYGQYINAQAVLKQARADFQQKQQNLELIRSGVASIGKYKLTSTVSAPITGTILNLQVEVGEPIISTESNQAATELMSLADMKDMVFKGSVSEQDAAHLRVGMPADITLASYPNIPITGELSQVGVQSEQLNGMAAPGAASFDNPYEVEINHIQFPKNILMRSGFSATAHIVLRQARDVLTLPERALKFDGNQAEVLLPDVAKKVGYRLAPVTLGLSNGINVQILSGVKLNEKIIDASMLGA